MSRTIGFGVIALALASAAGWLLHRNSRIRWVQRTAIPEIGKHDTAVLMHNDGVAQGLSEVPFMQDVEHWGVLTIGTGLGNARFTNRRKEKDNDKKDKADKDKKDKKGKD